MDNNNNIIMYSVHGNIFPIIKNPSIDDYLIIKDRFNELLPFAPKGEPYSRQTYDNKGNIYIWCSDDSMHYKVESFLSEKFNVICNQNKFMLEG